MRRALLALTLAAGASAADAIVASARGPHGARWYDAEHALNAETTRDRVAWLRAQLR